MGYRRRMPRFRSLASPARSERVLLWPSLALCVAVASCDGAIASNSASGDWDDAEGPGPLSAVQPAPAGRFARLTHTQWENSVRDLLFYNQTSGLSSTFPSDARSAGFLFDNHELALETDQVLSQAYASAAEALAASVTNDSSRLARLLPPGGASDRERARAFIVSFGERVFRRPLEPAEVDRWLDLYDAGINLYDDETGFTAGIRVLIEGLLQSPNFLYRVEGSTIRAGASIPLSDWEMGQRLSFLLINSTPDAELLAAARAGQLSTPDEVSRHTRRLLRSPASHPAIVGFHDQLLEFEKFDGIDPAPAFYPGLSEKFAEDVLASGRAFIEDLAFVEFGSFADLMTSSSAFVNAELADVYGVQGNFGDSLVKVELPAAERRGFLNQIGFLAANSTSVNPDPIHRGVFVAKRLLCIQIAAPPDGVPPLPPVNQGTNRQVVENHTQTTGVCKGCHETLINPFGFPFENYDASGAYRTTDNGQAVDASASPIIDGQAVPVANSVELAEALATSRQAHECFASHLVEYAFGRPRTALDQGLIDNLTNASLDGAAIVQLLIDITTSPAFMTRSTEELP
jgi:hypothetical protein